VGGEPLKRFEGEREETKNDAYDILSSSPSFKKSSYLYTTSNGKILNG